MHKKTITAIVVAIVLVGGVAIVLGLNNDTTDTSTTETTQQEDSNTSTAPTAETEPSSASIEEYLAQANDGGALDATGEDLVKVSIGSFIYEPTELAVSAGTTVTWTNDDSVRHNVVSWDESPQGGLESELLDNGESFSYTFDESGQYVYFCEPHPFRMRGVVTVVD